MRLFILCALVALPLGAAAHEGELDPGGGHVDETGAYHCHTEPCFAAKATKDGKAKAKPAKARRPVKEGTPAPEKKDDGTLEL